MKELFRLMSGYKHLVGDRVYVLAEGVLQEAYIFERDSTCEGDNIVKCKAIYIILYNGTRLSGIKEEQIYVNMLDAIQELNLSREQLSDVCNMRLIEILARFKQEEKTINNYINYLNQL